ncbi:ATP-binding protein [Thermodesulfovibrionales bacterium]|nr:ATP-binding protein [Thermodesulfovibrionales bacterium]MCL0047279.1 ATP-binding protein [Thermodesulfovibrionales bacterium]MCL0083460.1 ATP-binding protein [Thermodesulfovibrionales bacterium]
MNNELLVIIIILSIAVIFLVFRLYHFSSSIREVKKFSKELSSGNLNARLFFTGKGGLADIVRDITSTIEKTKTRLDSADAEMQKMEAILRGMSDGVLIVDTQGVIILANQTFKKFLSVKEDIEGKQIMEVLRNIQLIEMFRNAMHLKNIISEEINIPKDHKEMYIIATAVPVYSVDSVTGIVFTLHDITRLRQLEEVRKDFVANVSHEIKTPITAIKGFAETLLDGAIDDKKNAIRFLGMIQNHSERLNSLVNDLLALSKIELGDINIEKTAVNLEQVIDTVFMTLKEIAERKGLYLKREIPDGMQTLYADKNKLIQIILNIVDNGIKFTEKGGVTVGIDEAKGGITLYISDTGIGIPRDHIHRLGERFYRVDRARSRELGGTGLGLAIVKHLVNAHGWQMQIESEYTEGTKVSIKVR